MDADQWKTRHQARGPPGLLCRQGRGQVFRPRIVHQQEVSPKSPPGVPRLPHPRQEASNPTPRLLYQLWMTGIGRRTRWKSIRQAIELVQPGRVITSGFAGGLNPALKFGAIVYDQDVDAGLPTRTGRVGRCPGHLLLPSPRRHHRRRETRTLEIHRGRRRRDGIQRHPQHLPRAEISRARPSASSPTTPARICPWTSTP